MNFTLPCCCGQPLKISAIDAGRKRRCDCGVEYEVPCLMELRRLDAVGAEEIPRDKIVVAFRNAWEQAESEPIHTAAQKLQILDQSGRLPLERQCLDCNCATTNFLECFLECERAKVRRKHPLLMYWVIAILSPLDALKHYLIDCDYPEVIGEDVFVRAPLRLCPDCADRWRRQPQLVRERIQAMTLYQPLLAQYPEAKLQIAESRGCPLR